MCSSIMRRAAFSGTVLPAAQTFTVTVPRLQQARRIQSLRAVNQLLSMPELLLSGAALALLPILQETQNRMYNSQHTTDNDHMHGDSSSPAVGPSAQSSKQQHSTSPGDELASAGLSGATQLGNTAQVMQHSGNAMAPLSLVDQKLQEVLPATAASGSGLNACLPGAPVTTYDSVSASSNIAKSVQCVPPQHTTSSTHAGYLPPSWLQRTELLLGVDGLHKLANTRVLLVGLGGVGSFVAEFLTRSGIGHLTIVDGDVVDPTNLNRQLLALSSTVGQPKAHVLASRLRDINPDLSLDIRQEFLNPDTTRSLVCSSTTRDPDTSSNCSSSTTSYDYVIDCIDSVAPKVQLIAAAHAAGARVVSSMGAGGRLDPTRLHFCDISETHGDPFAATVRKDLRKLGINSGVMAVFSEEPVRRNSLKELDKHNKQRYKRSYYGTSSYIPSLFGLYIAAYVINDVVDGPLATTLRQKDKQRQRQAKRLAYSSKRKLAGKQRATTTQLDSTAASASDAYAIHTNQDICDNETHHHIHHTFSEAIAAKVPGTVQALEALSPVNGSSLPLGSHRTAHIMANNSQHSVTTTQLVYSRHSQVTDVASETQSATTAEDMVLALQRVTMATQPASCSGTTTALAAASGLAGAVAAHGQVLGTQDAPDSTVNHSQPVEQHQHRSVTAAQSQPHQSHQAAPGTVGSQALRLAEAQDTPISSLLEAVTAVESAEASKQEAELTLCQGPNKSVTHHHQMTTVTWYVTTAMWSIAAGTLALSYLDADCIYRCQPSRTGATF